jgi:GDP/UDP-N,N'-diacetylbacillosamine 2-epimerase (hydrolysing)
MLLLGDRYEIFVAATAAMTACVPIAHIHGGEATEGLIDEAIRHSISKMSHIHFVATEEYRRRVIQLGEQPSSVLTVGGMGVDCIFRTALMSRSETENSIGFKFLRRNLLITFHPVTLEYLSAEYQMKELLFALRQLDDVGLIFTMPNADTNSRAVVKMLRSFCDAYSNSVCFESLGHLRYLSCMKHVDGVVGNSSSGLIEAPSFNVGTVNIGDRQRGRQKAKSVIDCSANAVEISDAIKHLFSNEFREMLKFVENPYGNGGSSDKIVDALKSLDLRGLLKKRFFDLPSL